jgi:hypothetical protein
MTFKDYILEAMMKDLTVCQHLYEKIPAGSLDKRPREGMRSTRELLSYLAYIGSGTVETYIHGGWSKEENIARMKLVRDTANMIEPENFIAALDEEKTKITEAFATLTDEDLLTIETTQPWGTKVKLVEALLNNSMKYLAAYRLQLFTYAKMWGAEISTPNAWRGVDPKPKVSAQVAAQ